MTTSNPCSKELETGELRQLRDEIVLEACVQRWRRRLLALAVIPETAAGFRGGIFTGRQPGLREMALLQIVGRATPAHFGGHPARIHGVAQAPWATVAPRRMPAR